MSYSPPPLARWIIALSFLFGLGCVVWLLLETSAR